VAFPLRCLTRNKLVIDAEQYQCRIFSNCLCILTVQLLIMKAARACAGLMVFLLLAWASVGHKAASRSRYLGEGSVRNPDTNP